VARPPDFRSTHLYTFGFCSFWRECYISCSLQPVGSPSLAGTRLIVRAWNFSDYSTAPGETPSYFSEPNHPSQTTLNYPIQNERTHFPNFCTLSKRCTHPTLCPSISRLFNRLACHSILSLERQLLREDFFEHPFSRDLLLVQEAIGTFLGMYSFCSRSDPRTQDSVHPIHFFVLIRTQLPKQKIQKQIQNKT